LLVVSDTSPILNLVAVERLELLRDLYGSIVIPPAVSAELHANGIFLMADWVERIEPLNRAAVDGLRAELDAGESEAIVLGQQLKASLLLMDERLGRRAAIQLGLDVTGLLRHSCRRQEAWPYLFMRPAVGRHDRACGFLDRQTPPIRLPEGSRRIEIPLAAQGNFPGPGCRDARRIRVTRQYGFREYSDRTESGDSGR
jgi:uncharacterized protein